MKFPRTYADLEAAAYVAFIERHPGEDGVFIHINTDWLAEVDQGGVLSAHGNTLAEALQDLRAEFWDVLRPPSHAMGDGVRAIAKEIFTDREAIK